MKRVIVIVVFVILAVAVATAGPVSVGVTAGMPLTWAFGGDWDDWLDLLDDSSNTAGVGIALGGFGSYDVTPAITVQVEALVALYTWGMEGKNGADDVMLDGQLFLAEFPVLAKYRVPVWKGDVTVFLGPDIFYAIGRIETMTTVGSNPEQKDGGEPDERWIFGATGGVGYDLPLGPGFVSLDVRYTRMLTPLAATNVDPPYAEFEYYAHAVSVYLSYGFRLGT